MGLRTHINTFNIEQGPNDHTTESSGLFIQPTLGIEKRARLNDRWMIPYGLDALVSFNHSYNRQEYPSSFAGERQVTESRSKTYGGSLRPFLGITYSPIPRLYFSTEASAHLGYTFGNSTVEHFTNQFNQSSTKETHAATNLSLRPAAAIFVYYRF